MTEAPESAFELELEDAVWFEFDAELDAEFEFESAAPFGPAASLQSQSRLVRAVPLGLDRGT